MRRTRPAIEWYHRMEDVSGLPAFRSIENANERYYRMDAARLVSPSRKYHLDYAVLPDIPENINLGGKIVFSDSWFMVLQKGQTRLGP